MALYDMAQMTVASAPGTGPITLGAAAVADGVTYLTFAQADVPDGGLVSYRVNDGAAWELDRGVYTAAGTTLTRGLVKSSTGSLINVSAAAIVSIVPLKADHGHAPAVSWLAGVTPNNAIVYIADRAMTITGISGVPRVANVAAATVSVMNGAGTAVHSGSFNAAGTVGTVQPLTITTANLASGDYLYLTSTGTFTESVGNITVFVS